MKSNPLLTPPLMELYSAWLEPIRAQIPHDLDPTETAKLAEAITQEALRRFGAFLSGVKQYQAHPAARASGGGIDVLWQEGQTRLLDYAPESDGEVIFVVPSLVNRFEILDIEPEHSFLGFLVQQGYRPLVIDWQEPDAQEQGFSLTDYITRRLLPAMAFIQDKVQGGPCHVLGYCMGGLLALTLAVMKKDSVATLTLMATPWDFAVKGVGGVPPADTVMGGYFLQQARQWGPHLDQVGYVPSAFLQAIFTGFQSLRVLEKFARFGAAPLNDEESRRFVLTEDWLNNGVPLALPVAKECLRDWYEGNLTHKLQWMVAGYIIDPRAITLPAYVMIPQRDRIVPPESALPLAALIKNAIVHQPDMGHIGLMTGDEAPDKVWKPYVSWLRTQ